ncbi:hypothetical protein D9M72_498520 [compost metagenome]
MAFAQGGFFKGEGNRITQLAQHFQQAETQVDAIGLLGNSRLQHGQGLAPAAIGDVDVGAFQRVGCSLGGGSRNHLQRGGSGDAGSDRRRLRHDRRNRPCFLVTVLESHLGLASGLGFFQFQFLGITTGAAQQHPIQQEQQQQAGNHDCPPERADAGIALL